MTTHWSLTTNVFEIEYLLSCFCFFTVFGRLIGPGTSWFLLPPSPNHHRKLCNYSFVLLCLTLFVFHRGLPLYVASALFNEP